MNEETTITEPLLVLKPNEDNLVSTWTPTVAHPLLLQPSVSEILPRSPGRRKISESRGISLPDIKLHQQVSNLSNYNDVIVESPPPTASPVGHYLKTPFSRSPKSLEKWKTGILEICIFLPDQRGIQFKVEGGRMATVEQLSSLLWTHLNLKHNIATEMFSLWMCSPLLEVQLKPHHNPLEVRKFWPDLLRKFTTVMNEQCDFDEPLLMVKRNVLLSKARQLELVDQVGEKGIELLFLEAREAILSGRYLCPLDMCIQLAAIHLTMEWGPCNEHHTNEFIHQHLEELIPAAHLPSAKSLSLFGWTMPGCKGMEDECLLAYQKMSAKPLNDLRKIYLDLCMQLPAYGSAIFSGQIEQRHGPMPVKDLPVKVMISREFFCVVDLLKYNSLLTVPIGECNWLKHNSNSPQCLPSFFIHFFNPLPDSTNSKLLQIFTKQAVMMDALLTSSMQAWSAEYNDNTFEDLTDRDEKTFAMSKMSLYQTKCNRLCLATFDENGVCLDATGSLKMVVDMGR